MAADVSWSRSQPCKGKGARSIPKYLSETYAWAYLSRKNARLLDRDAVVNAVLLGNHQRLREAALSEIAQGQRVLQAAHVYGRLIPELARRVGFGGRLDVIDIVPLQVALCRLKLRGCPQARVWIADARNFAGDTYDVVNCFFLLHEIPDQDKRSVVDALLTKVAPGGKAIFIDYHAPGPRNPLRGFYRRLFDLLEPFAATMWDHEVHEFSAEARNFRWEKVTMFGGIFQKAIAHRRPSIQELSE
jgi:SAM-dependent methyltransferase